MHSDTAVKWVVHGAMRFGRSCSIWKFDAISLRGRTMLVKDVITITDEYIKTQTERLAKQKEVNALEEKEHKLKEQLVQIALDAQAFHLPASENKAINVHRKPKPRAEEWEKVYGYIVKYDAFDLLQKRLGEEAVKARWDDGIDIPGIIAFPTYSLTIIGKGK